MDVTQLNHWFPAKSRQVLVTQLVKRVGLTGVRAEYFVRLWVYLLVKQGSDPIPLQQLEPLKTPVVCSLSEVAELFYHDQDRGSDRAAGMILTKLVALGLIRKTFDGNQTEIEILPIPELLTEPPPLADVRVDRFDPRSDAIPVANLLAQNYNWMNRNQEAVPYRIMQLLRQWSQQYNAGMQVLRRCDNGNPVGFFLLYPTAKVSEANFFTSPGKGMHFSSIRAIDPFVMAEVGDPDCAAVFIRSWMIDSLYWSSYRTLLLQQTQATLREMQQDFPNLCDVHTLVIHPIYEEMSSKLGFQKTIQDTKLSVYWMYIAIDRFLSASPELG
jgi:hypothetical protein